MCACPDGCGLQLAANGRDCIGADTSATPQPPTRRCLPVCRDGGIYIGPNFCSRPTGWTGSYSQTHNTILLPFWTEIYWLAIS